jgi:RNA polymerase sigma-70 factor (ECF subfamily)
MDRMTEPVATASDGGGAPGSSSSFEGFFEAEHTRLLRALYVATGNRQEAEELMQDSFLAVWERWDRVRGMEDPTGYLYRTAMNRFRSRARRVARSARRALGRGDVGDEFAAADERDALARALAALPGRQRAAIVLTELLGYGSAEAGRILGVKDVTVRSLASQARASLRAALEDPR